jgi:cytochrome c-type biogenesis protein CcmH
MIFTFGDIWSFVVRTVWRPNMKFVSPLATELGASGDTNFIFDPIARHNIGQLRRSKMKIMSPIPSSPLAALRGERRSPERVSARKQRQVRGSHLLRTGGEWCALMVQTCCCPSSGALFCFCASAQARHLLPLSSGRRGYCAALLFMLMAFATPAFAVNPDEILTNPALEARARTLSQELRCLVCQNQSIDDSDAGLAKDLRVLLRERITAGDTDAQAMTYIVNRYGNFVLLKPPFQWNTALLWLTPALLLLLAGGGFYSYLRRGERKPEPTALNAEDEARLAQLLEDGPNR